MEPVLEPLTLDMIEKTRDAFDAFVTVIRHRYDSKLSRCLCRINNKYIKRKRILNSKLCDQDALFTLADHG